MELQLHTGDIGNYLKKHNIKPSYQRMKIFQYLLYNHNHPTVDTIYRALCTEIPTLSKTTVYNTLNLFIEKKLVYVIVIEGNETRYDLLTHTHGHFKCTCCGALFDVELSIDYSKSQELLGCDIEEKHIYFKGICRNCKERSN